MGCLVHTVSCVGMASTNQRSLAEVSCTSLGKYSAKTSDNECLGGGGRCGESSRLETMLPGFDSQTWRHIWVEFVGSLLSSEMFFSGSFDFPLPLKTNILFSIVLQR